MTKDEISAVMREMGRKGGRIGGRRAADRLTPAERTARARRAALARWRHPTAWSRETWPPGTRFVLHFIHTNGQPQTMTGCIVTRYTDKTIYWYQPAYDGRNTSARRQPLSDFIAHINRGQIEQEA